MEDIEAIKKLKAYNNQACDNGYDFKMMKEIFTEYVVWDGRTMMIRMVIALHIQQRRLYLQHWQLLSDWAKSMKGTNYRRYFRY